VVDYRHTGIEESTSIKNRGLVDLVSTPVLRHSDIWKVTRLKNPGQDGLVSRGEGNRPSGGHHEQKPGEGYSRNKPSI